MVFVVGDNDFFLAESKCVFRFLDFVIDRVLDKIAETNERIGKKSGTQIGIGPVKFCFDVCGLHGNRRLYRQFFKYGQRNVVVFAFGVEEDERKSS